MWTSSHRREANIACVSLVSVNGTRGTGDTDDESVTVACPKFGNISMSLLSQKVRSEIVSGKSSDRALSQAEIPTYLKSEPEIINAPTGATSMMDQPSHSGFGYKDRDCGTQKFTKMPDCPNLLGVWREARVEQSVFRRFRKFAKSEQRSDKITSF
jgi:hypothetical protein